jgi:hypothetical protein
VNHLGLAVRRGIHTPATFRPRRSSSEPTRCACPCIGTSGNRWAGGFPALAHGLLRRVPRADRSGPSEFDGRTRLVELVIVSSSHTTFVGAAILSLSPGKASRELRIVATVLKVTFPRAASSLVNR